MNQGIESLLSSRSEHRLLGLMLVLLHLALWWDFPGAISRSLMLAHLGLFLIWQPLWSRERRLDRSRLSVFVVLTAAFVTWLDWWLIAFWLVLLIGLVGGRVTLRRADRTAYVIAGFFLLFELLIGVVPAMFTVPTFSEEIAMPLGYGLLAFPAALVFLPGQPEAGPQGRAVDFLYGLTVALLVLVLVLGALLSMYHFGSPYPVALFQTVLGIAVFLLALSWAWTPFAGFSGLGQLWTRYLLNVGTPFEHWLGEVSLLAGQHQRPEQFLEGAMERLVGLPWVEGCEWLVGRHHGMTGRETRHRLDMHVRDLRVRIFTPRPMATALQLHGQLLVRLVSDFHQAKVREQELAQKAHLQAVHETGARITHDIKNLLQSLYAMAVAVQSEPHDDGRALQGLLRRQLPQLTRRLQLALDKLQAPYAASDAQRPLSGWWAELVRRNGDDGIAFSDAIECDPEIPSDVFDSVVENMLENARIKRQSDPTVAVEVSLVCAADGLEIAVTDSGRPIDDELASSLFSGPVHSRSGLGIGLYQSSRQALEEGYVLRLASNEPGRVRVALTRDPPAPGGAAGSGATMKIHGSDLRMRSQS